MSDRDESIVIQSLEGCARCGNTHAMLRFFKLDRPVRTPLATFSHWAQCPSRREPILMDGDRLPDGEAVS